MKIENWEREVISNNNIQWKHTTGIRIILVKQGALYKLFLLDKAGRTQFVANPTQNRSKLEAESAKWQRDYNKHLKKISVS